MNRQYALLNFAIFHRLVSLMLAVKIAGKTLAYQMNSLVKLNASTPSPVVVDKVLDASVLEQRYLSGTQKMILL
jgi:hypothetical protein